MLRFIRVFLFAVSFCFSSINCAKIGHIIQPTNLFCIEQDENGHCMRCHQGYKPNQQNLCEYQHLFDHIKPHDFRNCQVVQRNECVQCKEGYFKGFTGQCSRLSSQCIEQCTKCSIDNRQDCFQCKPGYEKNSYPPCSQCVLNHAKNSEGICTLIAKDCSPFQNCLFCLIDQCLICQQGYHFDQNWNCIKQQQHEQSTFYDL